MEGRGGAGTTGGKVTRFLRCGGTHSARQRGSGVGGGGVRQGRAITADPTTCLGNGRSSWRSSAPPAAVALRFDTINAESSVFRLCPLWPPRHVRMPSTSQCLVLAGVLISSLISANERYVRAKGNASGPLKFGIENGWPAFRYALVTGSIPGFGFR